MSSSSMSHGCPPPNGANANNNNQEYQIDYKEFDKKTRSVINETEQLEKEIRNIRRLQDEIDEFRNKNVGRTEEAKERMTEISNRITAAGKNMVAMCDEAYKKLVEVTHPYINSGVVPKEEGALSVLERCIQLQGSIRGLGEAMERTKAIGPIVLSQHNQLFSLEAKQREAVVRQKKLVNIKRLANEFPVGSPLHLLASLPAFLMSLDRNEKVSEYYQKKFEGMENEIFALFESLVHNEPDDIKNVCSILSTQASVSNGEVTMESIRDFEEIPIDTAQTSSFVSN